MMEHPMLDNTTLHNILADWSAWSAQPSGTVPRAIAEHCVVQLSPETVSHYLQACEDAYLLFSCPYFSYSEAKRARHNRKYYAIDTGLRRAVSTRAGQDLGKDFENLVYLILRRKTADISYWKGKGEVDFVVNTAQGATPIQVTYGEPKLRHDEAIERIARAFPLLGAARRGSSALGA
jgi:predicted AAA+ superfamily ATPase